MKPNQDNERPKSYRPVDLKMDMITKIQIQEKNNKNKPTEPDEPQRIQKEKPVQLDTNQIKKEASKYPFEMPTVFDDKCQLTFEQKLALVKGYDSPWPYMIEGWQKEEEWAREREDLSDDDLPYEDYFSEDYLDGSRKNMSYFLEHGSHYNSDSDEYDEEGEYCFEGTWCNGRSRYS